MNEVQEWRSIVGFPGYSVSDYGCVRSERVIRKVMTHRILTPTLNTRGIPMVGINQYGVQYKRSIAVLVAEAFIRSAKSLEFNTPINLDGDRTNNRADNLAWRPLWFARKYFQQIRSGPQGIGRPVQEMQTKEVFESSWHAALSYGLIEREIVFGILNNCYVWPTYQRFRTVS